jgi:hypothetical protein
MFIEFHPSINILIQVDNFNFFFLVKLMILQCIYGIWIEYTLQKLKKDKKWATLTCKVPHL